MKEPQAPINDERTKRDIQAGTPQNSRAFFKNARIVKRACDEFLASRGLKAKRFPEY